MSFVARTSWQNVRDRVHGLILDGTYRPGDKLPRDEDLAAELGCARTTLHRAMRALADTGIIERRRKGGTTVRTDPVTRATLDIPVTRLEVEARGFTYGYHLLERTEAVPPAPIAAALKMLKPHRMLRVQALHLADGRTYVLEDRWVSLQTVPEIAQVDLSTQSANEWLVRNRPVSHYDIRISAHSCDVKEAQLIGAQEGQAVLVVERMTWTNDAPITHVRATNSPGFHLMASSRS